MDDLWGDFDCAVEIGQKLREADRIRETPLIPNASAHKDVSGDKRRTFEATSVESSEPNRRPAQVACAQSKTSENSPSLTLEKTTSKDSGYGSQHALSLVESNAKSDFADKRLIPLEDIALAVEQMKQKEQKAETTERKPSSDHNPHFLENLFKKETPTVLEELPQQLFGEDWLFQNDRVYRQQPDGAWYYQVPNKYGGYDTTLHIPNKLRPQQYNFYNRDAMARRMLEKERSFENLLDASYKPSFFDGNVTHLSDSSTALKADMKRQTAVPRKDNAMHNNAANFSRNELVPFEKSTSDWAKRFKNISEELPDEVCGTNKPVLGESSTFSSGDVQGTGPANITRVDANNGMFPISRTDQDTVPVKMSRTDDYNGMFPICRTEDVLKPQGEMDENGTHLLLKTTVHHDERVNVGSAEEAKMMRKTVQLATDSVARDDDVLVKSTPSSSTDLGSSVSSRTVQIDPSKSIENGEIVSAKKDAALRQTEVHECCDSVGLESSFKTNDTKVTSSPATQISETEYHNSFDLHDFEHEKSTESIVTGKDINGPPIRIESQGNVDADACLRQDHESGKKSEVCYSKSYEPLACQFNIMRTDTHCLGTGLEIKPQQVHEATKAESERQAYIENRSAAVEAFRSSEELHAQPNNSDKDTETAQNLSVLANDDDNGSRVFLETQTETTKTENLTSAADDDTDTEASTADDSDANREQTEASVTSPLIYDSDTSSIGTINSADFEICSDSTFGNSQSAKYKSRDKFVGLKTKLMSLVMIFTNCCR